MGEIQNFEAILDRQRRLRQFYRGWQPHAKQKLVFKAVKEGYQFIKVIAGRQSGKTQVAGGLTTLSAGLNDRSVNSIITPSLKQGKKIYWKRRTIQDFGPREWVKKEQNDELTLFLHNGSYIEIDGSENIDAHRGDKKHCVVLDEFKDIDPRFLSEVVEPMFATTKGGVVLVIGTPPENPDSHFRQIHEHALMSSQWAVIHWTSYDSPYISNEWLDAKREELRLRGEDDVFRREYLGEYTVGGKNSVFPMFSPSLHVKPDFVVDKYFSMNKRRVELTWINDPSTSGNFGSLFVGYHREKGQLLYLDEIYESDKSKNHTRAIVDTAEEKVKRLGTELSDWTIGHDDAAAWFQNELIHGHDLSSIPAGKAAVKQDAGISLIKDLLLQKNSIVIAERCKNLVKEIENYIMVNGKFPLKGDDLIDCMRYHLILAQVILSLAEKEELTEDEVDEAFYYELLGATGLPTWTH